MAMNVGLDVGTTAVRAAAVTAGKSGFRLEAYGQVPLPPGAVVAGEIVDNEAVTAAVTTLWKKVKLPRQRVVLGIANQRVIVRRVDLPAMAEAEIKDALPYQVQESIPIPVEEALLDFVPLEEFTTPDGEPMLSALVVAAQRDMVSEMVNAVLAARVKVMAVDLQAFGVVRAIFGRRLNIDDEAECVVVIGGGLTQVAVVKGGAVRFLRIIPSAGDTFTRVLSDRLSIDTSSAEQLKRQVGIASSGTPERTGDPGADAVAVLTDEADTFIDEIRGSIDYYTSQSDGTAVARVLVAGNGARLPNLANRLGAALSLPVEPVRVLGDGGVEVGKVKLTDQEMMLAQPVISVPVGLAMWDAV